MEPPAEQDQPARRRRRRAVGPAGSVPAVEVDRLALQVGSATAHEPPPADDDDRLRRDVPPHHGS